MGADINLFLVSPPTQKQQAIVHIPPPPPDESELPPYSIPQDDPITAITAQEQIKEHKKRPKESTKTKLKKTEAKFDDLLSSIFEANDSLAQDTSERSHYNNQHCSDGVVIVDETENANMWFIYSNKEKDLCLSNAYLINLDDSIRKLESSTFYKELEVEKIINLQRILERSLENGSSAILSPSQLLDLDMQDMTEHAHVIDNTLKAIKVLFRIWLSGRNDKALYSEDLLTMVSELVTKVVEYELLPLCKRELGSHPIMQIKNYFGGVIQEVIRIFENYAGLITTSFLDESSVTKLEFLSIKVVFFEVSSKPKDMLISPTHLESLKVSSMLLISTLFGYYPDQHSFLLDEILSNFAKITGSKSSRVYHCSNGTHIQLITALITKIIQTVGPTDKELFKVDIESLSDEKLTEKRVEMTSLCTERIRSTSQNAAEILQYLISRAVKTTKTGDSPFRSLIESFTDDFNTLLTNPEWPAAELLMTTLSISLMSLLEKDSEGVMASTMALELLGNIALKLWGFKKNEDCAIELALNMSVLSFNDYCDLAGRNLSYLQTLIPKGMSIVSSYQYFLSLFTSILTSLWNGTAPKNGEEDEDEEETQESNENEKAALHEAAQNYLDRILAHGKEGSWIDKNFVNDATQPQRNSPDENYIMFLYSRNLVQLYDRILNSILRSLNHSRINIRTKALRTVSSLLAQSPDIFSLPQVQKSLSERIVDASAQVREASVEIVGKYMVLKPEFIKDFYTIVCDRSSDTGSAVRKRVVRLLQSIYHVVDDDKVKIEITERIIRRIEDEEKSISELATSILTELFFPPMKHKSGNMVDEFEQRKIARNIALILTSVWSRGEKTARFLRDFLLKLFHPVKGVATPQVIQTCKCLIEDLVEQASGCDSLGEAEQLLGLLSDIIGANGSYMTQDQLMLLSGFISDDSPEAQMACYYTLCIFHKTLDKMGPLRPQLLKDTQTTLLRRLGKFNLKELSEAIPCLWTVSVMKGEVEKIAKVCKSCLASITPSYNKALAKEPVNDPRLNKFLFILGNIGKYCQLDEYISQFQAFQPKGKPIKTVSELILSKCVALAHNSQSIPIRKMAVKNICTICTTHPLLFLSPPTLKVLDNVFNGSEEVLKDNLMLSLTNFLYFEEDTANATSAMKNVKKPDNVDLDVFLGVTDKFHNDAASASLMQRYLDKIMELALLGETEYAHTACLLLERIIRQGLANPRIAISTIIALETSKKREISMIARSMHTKLHDKHESLILGSYVEGAKHAASYRIRISPDIFQEFDGFSGFYYFLKGRRPALKKFLIGLSRTLDFEPTQTDEELDYHVKYIIYMTNSLSTLHFFTVEEVLYLIYGLDRIISGTGVSVSHYCEKLLETFEKTEQVAVLASPSHKVSENTEEVIDLSGILDATAVSDIVLVDTTTSSKARSTPSTQTIADSNGYSKEPGCSRNICRTTEHINAILEPADLEHYARCAVIVHMLWLLRQFLRKAYNLSEEKIHEFSPDKPGKDPKPASRSSVLTYERISIRESIDLISPFPGNSPKNLARIEAFVTQVSPESLNPDDYFDNAGDETLIASATTSQASKKRSQGSQSQGSKRRRNDDY